MIIGVDVDDTIIDMMTQALQLYNHDYDDNLTIEDIKSWRISDYVKCGEDFTKYFEDYRLYKHAVPINGAIMGINKLREMGHRVVFATSTVDGAEGRKKKWLKEWGLLSRGNRPEKDYIEVHDKSLLDVDVLVDDGLHNIEAFARKHNKPVILFTRPWNKEDDLWDRARHWRGVVELVKSYGM